MSQSRPRQAISRRRLLRIALNLGGLAAAAPLLQACDRAGRATPAPVSRASPTFNPSPTARPSPSATASPPPPPPTAAPDPTATPNPTAAPSPTLTDEAGLASVALVKTRDRAAGVRRALQLLGLNPVSGKGVLLKPNFNSADPAPGSTHPDTLRALAEELWRLGARSITVADRSGMGNTRSVMESLGVFELAKELAFDTLSLADLADEREWVQVQPPDGHWKRGFLFSRACYEAEALVQTCCLKTHRFGGHFSMSLKNSVGMVAATHPGDGYEYMSELHASRQQRQMIAEINLAYTPALVVLDGVEAFVSEGPERGRRAWGEVVLAGTDRVAIDAVGVALLRHLGCEGPASVGPIFQQEQLARAVALGLGVDAPQKVRLVTGDPDSARYAAEIQELLLAG